MEESKQSLMVEHVSRCCGKMAVARCFCYSIVKHHHPGHIHQPTLIVLPCPALFTFGALYES